MPFRTRDRGSRRGTRRRSPAARAKGRARKVNTDKRGALTGFSSAQTRVRNRIKPRTHPASPLKSYFSVEKGDT